MTCRFFIDTEFDGFGGELISLAIVPEINPMDNSLYLVNAKYSYNGRCCSKWVKDNVIPILEHSPVEPYIVNLDLFPIYIQRYIYEYITINSYNFEDVVIVADWPDDVKYFCECLITGPGLMVNVPTLKFEIKRVNSYPNEIEDAVQHNAWWDAYCLSKKY